MDTVCNLTAVLLVVAGAFLLIYLLRTMPRNEGKEHGGGFDGSSAAWGYPPLDSKDDPTIPPNEPDPDHLTGTEIEPHPDHPQMPPSGPNSTTGNTGITGEMQR